MKTHRLKIWPVWFDAVRRGVKTFEIRKDDRNFNVGDDLMLEEFKPALKEHTGRILHRRIVYIARGEDAEASALREGFCVLGIAPLMDQSKFPEREIGSAARGRDTTLETQTERKRAFALAT